MYGIVPLPTRPGGTQIYAFSIEGRVLNSSAAIEEHFRGKGTRLQHSVEADCRYLAGIIHAAGTGTLIKDEQAKIWHVQLAAYIYFRDQLASFMGQRNPATVSLPKDGGRKSGGFYSYDVHVKLSDEEIIEINPGTWGALQRRSYKLAKLSPCKF